MKEIDGKRRTGERHPLKQGLKHQAHPGTQDIIQTGERHPLKQGLKQGFEDLVGKMKDLYWRKTSTKTRIETRQRLRHGQAVRQDWRKTSTKTRIET